MDQKMIEQLVDKYLGIPYRHLGRDLNGVDCLGLAYLFYKDCGIDIPDNDGSLYEADWFVKDPERYVRGIRRLGIEVPLNQIQPLDFVYFRMGRGVITHGGVMVTSNAFIHVLERTRVHISPLDFKWRRRLAGARRIV